MEFKYSIDKKAEVDDIYMDLALFQEPAKDEIISIKKDSGQGPAIVANKAGWLFLAKICVEMAYMAEKDSDFHHHRGAEFLFGESVESDALSLFLADEKISREVIEKRTKSNA